MYRCAYATRAEQGGSEAAGEPRGLFSHSTDRELGHRPAAAGSHRTLCCPALTDHLRSWRRLPRWSSSGRRRVVRHAGPRDARSTHRSRYANDAGHCGGTVATGAVAADACRSVAQRVDARATPSSVSGNIRGPSACRTICVERVYSQPRGGSGFHQMTVRKCSKMRVEPHDARLVVHVLDAAAACMSS